MTSLSNAAKVECKHNLSSIQLPDDKISELTTLCDISAQLNTFQCHGLSDLRKASLMDRVDSKFLIPIHFLPNILAQLNEFYSVLEIQGRRISSYKNGYFDTPSLQFYFDTPSLQFYFDHHNGRFNRYKVRQRHYIDTDTSFLEVKFKNNKKRTIKSRIKLADSELKPVIHSEFVHQITKGKFQQLVLSQRSGYQRIALANEAKGERLTIDVNLWFEQLKSDLFYDERRLNRVTLSNFCIAELKQNKISKQSPFFQLMSAMQFAPQSFSKYCIGNSLLANGRLKSNRFKPILNQIIDLSYSTKKVHI